MLRRVGWWSLVGMLGCGGGPPPGAVDEEGRECPLTEPRGEVTLVAYQGAAWVGLDVLGRFQRSTPARERITCERRAAGPCEVVACQNLGVDFVDGEPACGSTSAGSLLVTRGAEALPPVSGSGRLTLSRDLAADEAFTVRTTGGDVPAFASTVRLPPRVSVIGPEALLSNGTVTVAPGEGLAVTWAPSTGRVVLIVTASNGGSFTAECAFDGAAGAGTVPPAALPEQSGHVGVWSEDRVDQRVGAFPVSVRARWSTGAGATVVRGSQ